LSQSGPHYSHIRVAKSDLTSFSIQHEVENNMNLTIKIAITGALLAVMTVPA